jgi:hypothetical protein
MKYRIIEEAMWEETGITSYRGYSSIYFVQRKTWYGRWKTMNSTLSLTLERAKCLLELAEQGKLNKKGERLYEI